MSPRQATSSLNANPICITTTQYTTEPIHAAAAWQQGYIGTGIAVAVIDRRIPNLSDLGAAPGERILYQQSFVTKVAGALKATPGTDQNRALQACPAAPPIPSSVSTLPPAPGTVVIGPILWPATYPQQSKASNVARPSTAPGQPAVQYDNPDDAFGHGTHVAGLIAGNGQASTGNKFYRTFYGAAPNANLVDLRVLDQSGQGNDSDVIAAIERAIALKDVLGIRVIKLSLGRPIWESYTLDPLCQAAEQAWKAGIVVVVAAGNDGRDLNLNSEGYGTVNAPGNDPYVITVEAMNTNGTADLRDDVIASYSSKGPSFLDQIAKPDIVAPGNLVISLNMGNGGTLESQNPTLVTYNSFCQTNGNGTKPSTDYFR